MTPRIFGEWSVSCLRYFLCLALLLGGIALTVALVVSLWGGAIDLQVWITASAAVALAQTVIVSPVLLILAWPEPARDPMRCPGCDYNLAGLVERICPECGRNTSITGSITPVPPGDRSSQLSKPAAGKRETLATPAPTLPGAAS